MNSANRPRLFKDLCEQTDTEIYLAFGALVAWNKMSDLVTCDQQANCEVELSANITFSKSGFVDIKDSGSFRRYR